MVNHLHEKHTIHRGIDVVGDENKGLKARAPKEPTSNTQKLKDAGKKAGDTLKKLDLFGRSVVLLTDNQEKYKSIVGGMISIWVLALLVVYFLYSVFFFIQRSGAIYSSVGETNSIPKKIDIWKFNSFDFLIRSPQELVAGIKITGQDKSDLLDNKKILNVTYGFYSKGTDQTISRIGDLIMVDCNEPEAFKMNSTLNAENEYQTFYELYELEEAKCFALDKYFDNYLTYEEQNITLQGNEISNEYSFIEISIQSCQNNTVDAIECETPEVIKQKVEKAKVKYIYTSKMFNANNTVEIPLVNVTSFLEYRLTRRFTREVSIQLQNNSLIDYWKLFDTNPKKNPFMSYSIEGQANLDFVEDNDFGTYPLLVLKVESSKLQETFTRKFMTIKEFFVDVSGILNGIMAGGAGFGMFINKIMMKIDLINKTFFLVEDEAEIKKKEKKKIEKKKTMTIKSGGGGNKYDPENPEKVADDEREKIKEENPDGIPKKKKKSKSKKKKEEPESSINPIQDESQISQVGMARPKFVGHPPADGEGGSGVEEDKSPNQSQILDESNLNSELSNTNIEDENNKKFNHIPMDESNDISAIAPDDKSKTSKTKKKKKKKAEENDESNLENLIDDEEVKEKKKKKKRKDSINEEDEAREQAKQREELEEFAAQNAKEGKVQNPFYKDMALKIPPKPKIFRKFKMTFGEVLMNFIPFCNSKEMLAKKKIFAECGDVIDSLTGIERIVQTIREYEEMRHVVLNGEEYKLLKQLTTPKIVIEDSEVFIKKINKFNLTDKELRQNYVQFVHNMNKIIDTPYISKVELSLLEIHKEAIETPHENIGEKDKVEEKK